MNENEETRVARHGRRPEAAVIIPCRDVGDYLHEAVESALLQAQGPASVPVEVVIVDDASTDPRTLELLDTMSKWNCVDVVKNQGIPGISDARNTGVRRSSAPWIVYLDGDDRLLPGAIRRRLDVVESYPCARWIGTDYNEWYGGERVEPGGVFMSRPRSSRLLHDSGVTGRSSARIVDPLHCFLEVLVAWVGAVMVRRDLHEEIGGFDPEMASAEDHDMWLRLAAVADYHFLPESTVLYRQRSGSASNSGRPPGDPEIVVYRKLIRDGVLRPWWPQVRKRLLEFHLRNVRHHRSRHEYRASFTNSLGAVRAVPWSCEGWKQVAASILRRP